MCCSILQVLIYASTSLAHCPSPTLKNQTFVFPCMIQETPLGTSPYLTFPSLIAHFDHSQDQTRIYETTKSPGASLCLALPLLTPTENRQRQETQRSPLKSAVHHG